MDSVNDAPLVDALVAASKAVRAPFFFPGATPGQQREYFASRRTAPSYAFAIDTGHKMGVGIPSVLRDRLLHGDPLVFRSGRLMGWMDLGVGLLQPRRWL